MREPIGGGDLTLLQSIRPSKDKCMRHDVIKMKQVQTDPSVCLRVQFLNGCSCLPTTKVCDHI
jgi:hypothetical protein